MAASPAPLTAAARLQAAAQPLRRVYPYDWLSKQWQIDMRCAGGNSTDLLSKWTCNKKKWQLAACATSEAAAAQLQVAARPEEYRLHTWGNAAAAQFSADGVTDGWDSDASEEESAEQKYMRERPCMQRRGAETCQCIPGGVRRAEMHAGRPHACT